MSSPEPLLILGATGKQGRKVISTLVSTPSSQSFTLLALTRDPTSPSAQALASRYPTVKLMQGNLDDVPSVFAAALEATKGVPIYGVFSVQQAVYDGATQERETKQGKDMVNSALANNVKVFVYSSVDRGVDQGPTYVPFFQSKHDVEAHLKEKVAASSGMTYTILRPVLYFDGLTPTFMGKVLATWIKTSLRPQKKIAFVATSDIGVFAAQAFLRAQSPEYKNQAISLAGDELTFEEFDKTFRKKVGYGVPTTFAFVANFLKWWHELTSMIRWFDEEGFEVDMEKLRRMHPGLMSFEDWLEKDSSFAMKK